MAEKSKVVNSDAEYLPLTQAAKFLGVSKNYLYPMNHFNRLTYFRPGGKLVLYKRSDLIKFIEGGRIPSADEVNKAV